MLREESGTVRVTVPTRQGRHGRPKPVGARFRLPGFRFSGAAMAMSTVVGISLATTWLVSEQQNVGRRPGVSNVGASPPVPSPEPDQFPISGGTTGVPATSGPVPRAQSQAPDRPVTASPSPGRSRATTPPVGPQPEAIDVVSGAPAVAPTAPAETPRESAAPVVDRESADPQTGTTTATANQDSTATPGTSAPSPVTASRPMAGGRSPGLAVEMLDVLAGDSERQPLGPSGTRHTVELTVAAPVTALQVEFRLNRPIALPGTLPWSSLPGAVVTVLQERGTVVYRFTVPPGLDVEPGAYVFAVHGAHAAPEPRTPSRKGRAAEESWTASAFGLVEDPHAVAVRGSFDQAA